MLERFIDRDGALSASWADLGVGAPTLIALAQICSRAWTNGETSDVSLPPEAQAILYAARHRGIIEVKGTNTAYESPSRLLTVFVEVEDQSQIRFRDPQDAQQNVQFLEGFRQLCLHGLVMHHLYHEFSLTAEGFARARTMSPEGFEHLLALGRPCATQ